MRAHSYQAGGRTVNHIADQPGERGRGASVAVLALTLAIAVTAPSLDRGGFTAGSQKLLVILAAAALFEAVLMFPRRLADAIRVPVIPILLALGGLAALSAVWTIGPTGTAVRWGLVILAYGLVATSGFLVASSAGVWRVALGVTLLAVVEAVLGLGSAALHERPWAEVIGGSWRPGGTFEYAAALGLLEVCGLPAALRASASSSRRAAYTGALALVLAGVTLGCADSRTDLGLAAVTLVFLGAFGDQSELPRRVVLASVGLLAVAMLAGALLLGRHVGVPSRGGGAGRLVALAFICLALAVLWPPLRALAGRLELRRVAVVAAAVIAAGAAIWLAVGYAGTLLSTGNGLDHGRISYWSAAVQAWEHRPALGSGAGTFAEASMRFQASHDRTLFAHDLPLELATELGVLGFLLGLSLYLGAGWELIRTLRKPEAWLLAPLVGCFLLANLVDWPWHLAGMGALWAAGAGAMGASRAVGAGAMGASRAGPGTGDDP